MNKPLLEILRPAVGKNMLMTLAGAAWLGVSYILCKYAIIWYKNFSGEGLLWYILIGVTAGLVIHHLGFLKIVNKNLVRIHEIKARYCLFGFMPWKSYILIAIMMTMGITLRHSSLPKIYLSIIYMGIGLALGLSSIRYFRHAWFKKKSRPN